MREYGQIQSAFWQSEDIVNASDGAKLLACYLLTGPHTNGVGCFVLPDGYILEDHPNWTKIQIAERFDELSRNGFAYRFDRVVFIPKFLMWNTIANGNIARARFLDWVAIPRGLMRQCAAVSMLALCGQWRENDKKVLNEEKSFLNSDFGNGSVNGLRNGLANLFLKLKNQHPTPPHPTPPHPIPFQQIAENAKTADLPLGPTPPPPPAPNERKKRPPKPKPPEPPPGAFEAFWELYPRSEGRKAALAAYAKAIAKASPEAILAALRPRVASHKWRTEPQFIPHASTWLNGERWNDKPRDGPITNGTSKTHQALQKLQDMKPDDDDTDPPNDAPRLA